MIEPIYERSNKMARKKDVHYKIDEGIVNEFTKIIESKKKNDKDRTITYSGVIEEMMKNYIALDGQLLVDEIHAPRIGYAVKKAVDDQMQRLIKMISKTQLEATAALYSAPLFHHETLKGMEEILENYMNTQLLDPARTRIADKKSFNTNGLQSIQTLRNIAVNDRKAQMKRKSEEEKSNIGI